MEISQTNLMMVLIGAYISGMVIGAAITILGFRQSLKKFWAPKEEG